MTEQTTTNENLAAFLNSLTTLLANREQRPQTAPRTTRDALPDVKDLIRPGLRKLIGNQQQVEVRTGRFGLPPHTGSLTWELLMDAAAKENLCITRRSDPSGRSGLHIFTITGKASASSSAAPSTPAPANPTPAGVCPAPATSAPVSVRSAPAGKPLGLEKIEATAATAPPPKPEPIPIVITPVPAAAPVVTPEATRPESELDPQLLADEARHLQVTLAKARIDVSIGEAVRICRARREGAVDDPSVVAALAAVYQVEQRGRGVVVGNAEAVRFVYQSFSKN